MNDKKYASIFNLGSDTLMRTDEFTTNFIELGFEESDVDSLIEIALDLDLKYTNSNDENRQYAPCHAIVALAQLKSLVIFDELIKRLDFFDEDDYYRNSVFYYLQKVGFEKTDCLIDYFLDINNKQYDRMLILEALESFFNLNTALDEKIENALVEFLHREDELEDGLNAIAIHNLIDLTQAKYIDLIRNVFKKKPVDIFFDGDIEDIEIKVGLRQKRDTPRPRLFNFPDLYNKPIPQIAEAKLGRNEPCHCGSGKKYKKCCLNK